LSRLKLSKANVEKVVNDPKNPIIKKIFRLSGSISLFSKKLTNRPIKKHPKIFITKIPKGKLELNNLSMCGVIVNLRVAPTAPPKETNKIFVNMVLKFTYFLGYHYIRMISDVENKFY
tara:strand:+ start:668 stop:1021 length:354 start_codon:yes stop_codon:yes gene_type:complete